MDLNTKINVISVVIATISCVVAIKASRHSRFSAREAKRSADVAEATFKAASYEIVNSLPAIDVVETVKVGDKTRVKLMLFNLRDKPFKIESVNVEKYSPVERNIKNIIKHWIEPFDWNYRLVEGIVWNPKGNLDDQEYYVKDATQYSLVNDKEVILITIPDFDEQKVPKYKFIVKTTFGTTKLINTFIGNNTLFCRSYNKEIT